jgi:hypothetical protein
MNSDLNIDKSQMIFTILKDTSYENDSTVMEYLQTLDKITLQAFIIGKSHLKSSFDILRCNGYIEWMQQQSK